MRYCIRWVIKSKVEIEIATILYTKTKSKLQKVPLWTFRDGTDGSKSCTEWRNHTKSGFCAWSWDYIFHILMFSNFVPLSPGNVVSICVLWQTLAIQSWYPYVLIYPPILFVVSCHIIYINKSAMGRFDTLLLLSDSTCTGRPIATGCCCCCCCWWWRWFLSTGRM